MRSLAGSPRAIVFLLALALRLTWVFARGSEGLRYSDDASAYNDLAVNLVHHHHFVTIIDAPHDLDTPYAQRPPLTPFLIAGVYAAFGLHLLAVQIVFAIIGAFGAVLVFELAYRLFGQAVAVVAGLLTASYPFFVFLPAVPLTENLALVLFTLLALLFIQDRNQGSLWRAAGIGGVLGLASLDRPQLLGFLPFLLVLALMPDARKRTRRLAWVSVAVCCWLGVIAPWVIRNRVAVGEWAPISLQGGLALYAGNNPYTQTPINGLLRGASGWYEDARMRPAVAGLAPVETDRKAFRLGLSFILQHPARSAWYSVQKLRIFFSPYANWVARLSWYPLLGLSLIGFFLTRNRWRDLLPIYSLIAETMLVAAVFTSMPRFRAPVEPFFILMAAYVLHQGWIAFRKLSGPRSNNFAT